MPAKQQAPEQQAAVHQAAGTPALDVRVTVPTPARMRDLGERLAGLLRPGDLIVLSGPLGAGKTTLTQGIGAGLQVRGPVTSPTFVIARVHPSLRGGPGLVHADAYRLGSQAEVDDLDLDADLASSVTVVEWGDGLVEELASSFLRVAITAPPIPVALPGAALPDPVLPDPASPRPRPGDDPPGDLDELRIVRLVGWGGRWQDVADAARQVLVPAPDHP